MVRKKKVVYRRKQGRMKEKTLRCHLKSDVNAHFVVAFTISTVLQRCSLTTALSIIELISEPTG